MGVVIDAELTVGDAVEVLPIDYGFQPTRGKTHRIRDLLWSNGTMNAQGLLVHFPRLGFQVRPKTAES